MVYVGESAGAIITAKDIDYNKIMDDKTVAMELNDTEALNEVDFYVLPSSRRRTLCRKCPGYFGYIQRPAESPSLNNHQALLVEGEEVKVLEE